MLLDPKRHLGGWGLSCRLASISATSSIIEAIEVIEGIELSEPTPTVGVIEGVRKC